MKIPVKHKAQLGLLGRLIKLTGRREDFFTECFAAVLQSDIYARREYWRMMVDAIGAKAAMKRITPELKTQISSANRSARPDLTITGGGLRIAVEHKLAAPQGRDQLLRYLQLPRREVTHVTLVAADYQTIPARVLANDRRYIRPSSRKDHFLWADFYSLIARSAARGVDVAKDTQQLFDDLGLHPVHRLIGDLKTQDDHRRQAYDLRLARAWQPLSRALVRRDWSVYPSIGHFRKSELYILYGPSDNLPEVRLDPVTNPGSLRIFLKSDRRAKRDNMVKRLEKKRGEIPHGRHLVFEPVRLTTSTRGNHWAVETRIPWRILLRQCEGVGGRAKMPETLKRFVLQLMEIAAGDTT